jgi:hypothetical protein
VCWHELEKGDFDRDVWPKLPLPRHLWLIGLMGRKLKANTSHVVMKVRLFHGTTPSVSISRTGISHTSHRIAAFADCSQQRKRQRFFCHINHHQSDNDTSKAKKILALNTFVAAFLASCLHFQRSS